MVLAIVFLLLLLLSLPLLLLLMLLLWLLLLLLCSLDDVQLQFIVSSHGMKCVVSVTCVKGEGSRKTTLHVIVTITLFHCCCCCAITICSYHTA